MKAHFVGVSLSGIAALAIASAGWRQTTEIARLQTELHQRQHAQRARASVSPTSAAPTNSPPPLTEVDKLELLRLRAEVTRLRQRQLELPGLETENRLLRARFAANSTNPVPTIDPGTFAGYVRRRDAQFTGQATPEAAFQSFLWAIEHRDANRLLALLEPEAASNFRGIIEREGLDGLWPELRKMPGFRLTATDHRSEKEAVVSYEIFPGDPPQPMRFRKFGEEWRMEF